PMDGWRRAMSWEDTGLPWVAPSPNMPSLDTARVYPGGCLIEGTNLSEGRGTTRPFELVGAPYLDGRRLARALTQRRLPGVPFRAPGFPPPSQKWKGRLCEGVQVHVSDRARFRPFATYLALIAEARRQAPRHFRWRPPPYEFESRKLPIDLLCGGDRIRRAIERGTAIGAIERSWRSGLDHFARARRKYLLYGCRPARAPGRAAPHVRPPRPRRHRRRPPPLRGDGRRRAHALPPKLRGSRTPPRHARAPGERARPEAARRHRPR